VLLAQHMGEEVGNCQVAVATIRGAEPLGLGTGAPFPVLADAGYGNNTEFRQGLVDRQLHYVVGVESNTAVLGETDATRSTPVAGESRSAPAAVLYRGQPRVCVTWRLPCPPSRGARLLGGRAVKVPSGVALLPAGCSLLMVMFETGPSCNRSGC